METVERYTKNAVQALKQEESDIALYLKAMGEKLWALMGEIKDNREQQKQSAATESGHGMPLVSPKRTVSRGSARPNQPKGALEMDSRHRHNRRGAPRGCGDGGDGDGRERAISPRVDRGEQSQLFGRYGIWSVDPSLSNLEETGSCRR